MFASRHPHVPSTKVPVPAASPPKPVTAWFADWKARKAASAKAAPAPALRREKRTFP